MRADAQRNAQVLLATAREVFAEKGPDAPLDEIAKRAGVGPGTLYRHFPNRDALIEAVYRDQVAELSGKARELIEAHPDEPLVALELWMRAQVHFVNHQRGLGVRLKAVVDPNSEVMALCKSQMRTAVEELIEFARPVGLRKDLAAYDLMRIGHGLGLATETASEDEVERLVQIMVNGLREQG